MEIKIFKVNMLEENCFVVSNASKECVIIDCGAMSTNDFAPIKEYINSNGLKPVHHLLTHGHFDHIAGSAMVEDAFGIKPEIHAADEKLYKAFDTQTTTLLGERLLITLPALARCFNNSDEITFGDETIKVVATPGHSPGGVFYVFEKANIAFCGDTIFRGSIGRTDFMGGSMFQIINSLRYVAQMPDDMVLYPGHGLETTVGYELAHNPYMDR